MIALSEPVLEWLELQWARALSESGIGSQVLLAEQRLVLGLVLFTRHSYCTVARATGLSPAQVSGQCAAGLSALGRALDR